MIITQNVLGLNYILFCGLYFKHKELSVTVDKPCVLMVKDINAKSANLHIADPGQTQSPIQVELKIGKKKQALTADFSQTGIYAGATKQYTVKL